MAITTTATCDACGRVIDRSRAGNGIVNTSNAGRLEFSHAPNDGDSVHWSALFCPQCATTISEELIARFEIEVQRYSRTGRGLLAGYDPAMTQTSAAYRQNMYADEQGTAAGQGHF